MSRKRIQPFSWDCCHFAILLHSTIPPIISFTYEGGIDAFIRDEVLTYAPDAYVDEKKTQIGYEISFTKYLENAENFLADVWGQLAVFLAHILAEWRLQLSQRQQS